MKKLLSSIAALGLASAVPIAFAQTPIPLYPADNPGFIPFNDDAGTGVSPGKFYTHHGEVKKYAGHPSHPPHPL